MVGQLAELQDVASLRTGQALELDLAHVDMVKLARDAVGRQQHNGGNHKFSLHIPDIVEGGLVGEWDASRLARVLDNLLGNAVKFSPHGGTISVTLARTRAVADEPATVVELRVVDDGMGIPADDLPHIFDWFRRASNAKGKIAGTGIGLAAARQIVELHGGSIHAESSEGSGSSFTVLLPLVDDSTSQSIGSHCTISSPTPQRTALQGQAVQASQTQSSSNVSSNRRDAWHTSSSLV